MPEKHVTLDADTYEAIAQELAILRHQVSSLEQAEAALRRQEQQFRSLVENIPGAVYRQECNADWTARFFSEAVEEVYGYPVADFIGDRVRSVASVIHPDDREMVERLVHEAVAVKQPYVLEYRVNHGDGTIHWVYEKGQGIFSETGELLYLDGVIIDISDRVRGEIERKQAEQKLQDSENFLNAIINGVADPLFVKDEQHHYCFVSDSYCELIGSDREALLGKTDYELFPSLEADEFVKADQLIFDTEIPQEHEEAITNHWGETHIFSTKKACFRDATGRKFMVATIRDITSRQETEQQLKNSEKFLHAILNGIADPLFVKDQQHRYIVANNAFRELFVGRSWSEVIGKTDHELFSIEEAEALRKADQRAFDTEMEQEDEELVTDIYGNTHTVSTKKSYFRDTAGNKFLVGTIRDITALKHAESSLIQANEALENRVEERTAELRQTVVQLQQVIFDREQTLLELKQVETQLQEQAKFLQSIWDGVDYGIFVLTVLGDGTDFRYRGFNSAMVRHSPIPVKNLVGKTVRSSLPPEVTQPLLKRFTECVRAGQTLIFEERFLFEEDYLWWQLSVSPLRDRDGHIDQLIVTAIDITTRKRMEEQRHQAEIALRQSEAQLRQRTQDLEGALQELQQTQLQLIQSEKMSSLGQLVAGVAHEINNPVNFIYGNLVYANDYTQNLLELLKLYQEHYPHPEAPVRAKAEDIDLSFLVQDMPRLLASMKVGADRIQKIVASLRNFSRMDESEMKEVNIHDGINSTLMILQNRLKAKPHFPEIKLIKAYGNLPLVECYAGQLNQVFMNVLCNAIDALEEDRLKFSNQTVTLGNHGDSGGDSGIDHREWDDILTLNSLPCIRIQTAVLPNNRILISIADNGPGLSESARKRLFDPFFTTKPVGKGTGMGLSISYQIVTEKHGGSLQCNSAPGQGAEFLIEIPIRQRSPLPKSS